MQRAPLILLGAIVGATATLAAVVLAERLLLPDRGLLSREAFDSSQIVAVNDALERYFLLHGRYPTGSEGLDALVPDLLPALPRDAYGQDLVYDPRPELSSLGRDKVPGGAFADADISLRCDLTRPGNTPALPFHLKHLGEIVWLGSLGASVTVATRFRNSFAIGTVAGVATLPILPLLLSLLISLAR